MVGRPDRIGVPVFTAQGAQTMFASGLVTSWIVSAILIGRRKSPANGGTVIVDGATNGLADPALEGDTFRVMLVCAPLHAARVGGVINPKSRWDRMFRILGIGFAPVKLNSEGGAACATA